MTSECSGFVKLWLCHCWVFVPASGEGTCSVHRTLNLAIRISNPTLGLVSRKSRKLFRPEKAFVKLQAAYSVKLVFSYDVKGIEIKITAKFCVSRRLRFNDAKGIRSPEMRPKSFRTFEKRAPDHQLDFPSVVPGRSPWLRLYLANWSTSC